MVVLEVGYIFDPTDHELVQDYLFKKVSGQALPLDCPVKECDLYGIMEPWEIWDRFGGGSLNKGEDIYFFTRLKKLSPNGKRFNRKIGMSGGTRHGESNGNSTTCGGIGWRLDKFRYENSKDHPQHGRWLLHEYSLVSQPGYVLCRLRKNDPQKKRKYDKCNDQNVLLVDWDDDFDSDRGGRSKISHADDHVGSDLGLATKRSRLTDDRSVNDGGPMRYIPIIQTVPDSRGCVTTGDGRLGLSHDGLICSSTPCYNSCNFGVDSHVAPAPIQTFTEESGGVDSQVSPALIQTFTEERGEGVPDNLVAGVDVFGLGNIGKAYYLSWSFSEEELLGDLPDNPVEDYLWVDRLTQTLVEDYVWVDTTVDVIENKISKLRI